MGEYIDFVILYNAYGIWNIVLCVYILGIYIHIVYRYMWLYTPILHYIYYIYSDCTVSPSEFYHTICVRLSVGMRGNLTVCRCMHHMHADTIYTMRKRYVYVCCIYVCVISVYMCIGCVYMMAYVYVYIYIYMLICIVQHYSHLPLSRP